MLLNHVEGMLTSPTTDNKIMPFAAEAAWVTSRWGSLVKFINRFQGDPSQDFNMSLATVFASLHTNGDRAQVRRTMQDMRDKIAAAMTTSATASLQASHELLLKAHVLADLEVIIGMQSKSESEQKKTLGLLDSRLDVIGAYFDDKQYILGIRRAAMELMRYVQGPV